MDTLKNNKGMALVTVLFLIVIFALVGTLILNFTVSNAKQTKTIEEDMKAVDAAEMGIVRYRNELVTKLNDQLKGGIDAAIKSIDNKNKVIAQNNAVLKKGQTPTPYIEINSTTVLDEMKQLGFFNDTNRFKIGYNPNETFPVFPGSTDVFSVQELPFNTTAPEYPQKLYFEIVSKGKSAQDENEIKADFTFDLSNIITKYVNPGEIITEEVKDEVPGPPYLWDNDAVKLPIGSKDCNHQWDRVKQLEDDCIYSWKITNGYYINKHIENIDSHIKDNLMTTDRGDLKLINSNLYVEGNVFGSTISQFSNSNLQVKGNITFGNMNGNAAINNVKFKATDKISLGTIGGTGISNSMLHGGEQVNIDNINNGGINNSQISSKKEINFQNLNKGVVDSLIYANDNINFHGNMNDGGIIRSTIYTNDLLNFKVMNKGIQDSYIYSKNNMNFDTFNGGANIVNSIIRTDDILNLRDFNATIQNGTVIYAQTRINLDYGQYLANMNGNIESNAYVCSGGRIANGIKKKATNNNVIENVSFDRCLELAGKKVTKNKTEVKDSNVGDFLIELEKAVNEADYKYN